MSKFHEMIASGSIGMEAPHPVQAAEIPGTTTPGTGMLGNLEGHSLDVPRADISGVIPIRGGDDMFKTLKPGALEQSVNQQLGDTANNLVTKEHEGEQGIKLEKLGQGERVAPPHVQGDLQLGEFSVRGDPRAAG